MTNDQAALVERVRTLLADEPSTREVSMFGGQSFMVNDKMIAGAFRNGDLLVRVATTRGGELIETGGASPAEMGAGRTMGPGWLSVAADSITSEDRLSFWIAVALEFNQSAGNAER